MYKCPFCGIVQGQLSAQRVYEDQDVIAFIDVAPQAPVHILVVPKAHVQSASAVEDPALWGRLMTACTLVARQLKIEDFRLVVNCGAAAGQTVPHLHVHLLAGRLLGWPPG